MGADETSLTGDTFRNRSAWGMMAPVALWSSDFIQTVFLRIFLVEGCPVAGLQEAVVNALQQFCCCCILKDTRRVKKKSFVRLSLVSAFFVVFVVFSKTPAELKKALVNLSFVSVFVFLLEDTRRIKRSCHQTVFFFFSSFRSQNLHSVSSGSRITTKGSTVAVRNTSQAVLDPSTKKWFCKIHKQNKESQRRLLEKKKVHITSVLQKKSDSIHSQRRLLLDGNL